jgi:hypothetical protein
MSEIKTLYMETTKKEPEDTSSEIIQLLKKYGLSKFMFDYEGGEIVGCLFMLKINDREMPIKLPIRWMPLWEMAQNGETKYIKDEQQAKRVAWRQVLRWIESQLALVNLQMVDIGEVFLPYFMIDETQTLYQHMIEHNMKLIEEKK